MLWLNGWSSCFEKVGLHVENKLVLLLEAAPRLLYAETELWRGLWRRRSVFMMCVLFVD